MLTAHPTETISSVLKNLHNYTIISEQKGYINGIHEPVLLIESKLSENEGTFEEMKDKDQYRWLLYLNGETTYLSPALYEIFSRSISPNPIGSTTADGSFTINLSNNLEQNIETDVNKKIALKQPIQRKRRRQPESLRNNKRLKMEDFAIIAKKTDDGVIVTYN